MLVQCAGKVLCHLVTQMYDPCDHHPDPVLLPFIATPSSLQNPDPCQPLICFPWPCFCHFKNVTYMKSFSMWSFVISFSSLSKMTLGSIQIVCRSFALSCWRVVFQAAGQTRFLHSPTEEHFGGFQFLCITIKMTMRICIQTFVCTFDFILWDKISSSRIARLYGECFFVFLFFIGNCQTLFQNCPTMFLFSPATYKKSNFSVSSPAIGIVTTFFFLNFNWSNRYVPDRLIPHVVLIVFP